jgi:hypothetical protein
VERGPRVSPASPGSASVPAACVRLALGASLAVIVGCSGGSISQSEMARYALRNKPEPEEETKPAPKKPAQPPAARVASADRATKRPSAAAAAEVKPPPVVDVSQPISDTQTPPRTPLAPEERTKRSVTNLERIAEAFHKHLADKGYYPARATFDGDNANLSWRVALLPYLGYQRLFDEFRLDEPWNSRHNYELLKKIPSVYQSPERFDDHTNYEVAVSTSTVFSRKGVVRIRDFEDGAKDTAMVVEVDDVAAVPWTAPREFEPDSSTPGRNLGTLRDGSFFLIWGNAEVGRVATSSSPALLRAMFTHDSGEVFNAGQVDRPLFEAPPRVLPTASASPSDGSPPGRAAAPTTSAALTVDSQTGTLAAEFTQQCDESLARGDERDAVSYFYAAAVTSPAGGSWVRQYQWVPALRRPAAVVRFGIGLDYSGPQESRLEPNATRSTRQSSPQSRAWTTITGDFGQKIVDLLAEHQSTHGNASLLAQQPAQKKGRSTTARRPPTRNVGANGLFAPGVEFLAASRESTILKLAEREQADLVLVVDWRETARGGSVGMDLVDVVRGASVWKMPRVQSREIEKARANPLTDNPLDEALRDFQQFLEEQCVFLPIPAKLQARHASQRVTSLAANDEFDPLRALAEMRLYQELGLIDAPQLLKGYQAKVGDDDAVQLLLGSLDARRRLLKTLLPAPSLVADRHRPTGSP